jgi:glutaredoxin
VYHIYGITDCPSCLLAQAELMRRDIEYVFINTDFSSTYRSAIKEEMGWSTFPIIIKATSGSEEELIGGYDDLLYILDRETKAPT